jgi:hypothetical protein
MRHFTINSLTYFKLVPCFAMVFILQWVPESPRWLLMHDRIEEGHEALRRYLGKGLSLGDEVVTDELMSIRGSIEIERQSQISFKEVILRRDRSAHLRRLLLGCGTQFMQQFGGINALNYYVRSLLNWPCHHYDDHH